MFHNQNGLLMELSMTVLNTCGIYWINYLMRGRVISLLQSYTLYVQDIVDPIQQETMSPVFR